MRLKFTKMSGAGNDFVVIDNRDRKVRKGARVARNFCDRRWGIGADGLLLLERSRRAAYRMMYYNADGSYGGMCGNGGRCIAWYAVQSGIAPMHHSFEALGNVYEAKVKESTVILKMKNPRRLEIGKKIKVAGRVLRVTSVDTGSPHVVVSAASVRASGSRLSALDVVKLGRKIRFHRAFGVDGTNVNFVEKAGPNTIRMRTYERGVENETLACGTGSIACAVASAATSRLKSPVTVITKSGRRLQVRFTRQGDEFREIELTGPVKAVFSGTVDL